MSTGFSRDKKDGICDVYDEFCSGDYCEKTEAMKNNGDIPHVLQCCCFFLIISNILWF